MVIKKHLYGKDICFSVEQTGADFLVTITGGDRPHIGAAAMGIPCEINKAAASSASTITVPGHKDYIVAQQAAEILSKELGTNVAVCCGIHYDGATEEMIGNIQKEILSGIEEIIGSAF